jgi:cell division protein ZapA
MSSVSLKIHILGKEYQVNCPPEERDALQRSAELLNEKMEEIRSGSQIIGLERIAVMAALNLAHDLIQTEQSAEQNSFASDVLQTMNSKIDSALFELTN